MKKQILNLGKALNKSGKEDYKSMFQAPTKPIKFPQWR